MSMIRLPPTRIELTPGDYREATKRLLERREAKLLARATVPESASSISADEPEKPLSWLIDSFPRPGFGACAKDEVKGQPLSYSKPCLDGSDDDHVEKQGLSIGGLDGPSISLPIRSLPLPGLSELKTSSPDRGVLYGEDVSSPIHKLPKDHERFRNLSGQDVGDQIQQNVRNQLPSVLSRRSTSSSSNVDQLDSFHLSNAPAIPVASSIAPDARMSASMDPNQEPSTGRDNTGGSNSPFSALPHSNHMVTPMTAPTGPVYSISPINSLSYSADAMLNLRYLQPLPPQHRPAELQRQFSRGNPLPRSPLYMSQAVASSSPEKRSPMKVTSSGDTSDVQPRLPLVETLEHHQMDYVVSSEDLETGKFDHKDHEENSDDSDDEILRYIPPPPPSSPPVLEPEYESDGASVLHGSPSQFFVESPPFSARSRLPFDLPEREQPEQFAADMLPSSPDANNHIDSQSLSASSPENSSPDAIQFLPTRRQRAGGAEQLPVTPIGEWHHQQTPRFNRLLTPPPPPTTPRRRIRVYDDRLPPGTQPQTPVNRHAGPFNPAFTAPAAPFGTGSSPRRRWLTSRRYDTGAHRSRALNEQVRSRNESQENTTAEGEHDRLMQRLLRDSGIMRRVNSWVRTSNGEELERTPPRTDWLSRA